MCTNPPPENDDQRCIVIRSTVSVFLDRDETKSEVRELIITGLREAFQDGSFLAAIPE